MTDPTGDDAVLRIRARAPAHRQHGRRSRRWAATCRTRRIVPRKQVDLVGAVGLGHPAVQLGHPHLRLRLALPGLRQLPAARDRAAARPRRPGQRARARRPVERLRTRDDARRHPDRCCSPPCSASARTRRASSKRWLACSRSLLALCSSRCSSSTPTPPFFWLGAGAARRSAPCSRRSPASTTTRCSCRSRRRSTIGKVSGLGWGLGYIGGIISGARDRRASDLRRLVRTRHRRTASPTASIAVGARGVDGLFALPLLPATCRRRRRRADARAKVSFFRGYVRAREGHPPSSGARRAPTFWFLLASAVYRDGLAGVFTFGGILAAVTFDFSPNEVIIFGDRREPRRRAVARSSRDASTTASARSAVIVFALVGPRRDGGHWCSSLHDAGHDRLLDRRPAALPRSSGPRRPRAARSSPGSPRPGEQGEIFGLYATTGRVASFISPALWTALHRHLRRALSAGCSASRWCCSSASCCCCSCACRSTCAEADHPRPRAPDRGYRGVMATRTLASWLALVDRLVERNFSAALDEHGITRMQWRILTALADGEATADQLDAALADLPAFDDDQTAAEQLDELVESGWVDADGSLLAHRARPHGPRATSSTPSPSCGSRPSPTSPPRRRPR